MFINVLALTFPIYMLQVYDKVMSSYSIPTLWVITIAAIVALVLQALLTWIRSRLLVRAGVEFDHLLSADVLHQNLQSISTSMGRVSLDEGTLADVQTLRNFMAGSTIFAFFDIPWMPIYFLILFIMHPVFGYIAVAGGVVVLLLGIMTERMTKKRIGDASLLNRKSAGFTSSAMRNADVVRSMGMVGNITERWRHINHQVIEMQTLASKNAGALQAITRSFRQSLMIFVYCAGAVLAINGQSSAGMMIAASIIMGRALSPIDQGMAAYKQSLQAWASYKRLKKMMDDEKTRPNMDLPDPSGEISVENLYFGAGGRPIIKGINFRLGAGQSMAIIGPSAAGKSTLCKLMLNIWPPTAGKVRLDRADITSWNPDKLGIFLGYLPQDVELFAGSIADNIARLGVVDSQKVIKAARLAGVHDMILHLPKGYDTPVGEMGAGLSGGQRQRIGLARALYGDPRIIILDEPNSNLDEEGDMRLAQSLAYMKQLKSTVIIVTHKMQILNLVDYIMILQEGQIYMWGPRQQVLAKLAQMQKQREEEVAKKRATRQQEEIDAQQAKLENNGESTDA